MVGTYVSDQSWRCAKYDRIRGNKPDSGSSRIFRIREGFTNRRGRKIQAVALKHSSEACTQKIHEDCYVNVRFVIFISTPLPSLYIKSGDKSLQSLFD